MVLAVGDVALLRKVFKRLIRKSIGKDYARRALADLKKADDKAAVLAAALEDMI